MKKRNDENVIFFCEKVQNRVFLWEWPNGGKKIDGSSLSDF